MVDPSKIRVRTEFFGLRKVREPVDIFMNMFGIASVCFDDWSYRNCNERIYQWALEIWTRSTTGQEGWRATREGTGWTIGWPRQIRYRGGITNVPGHEFSDWLSSFSRAWALLRDETWLFILTRIIINSDYFSSSRSRVRGSDSNSFLNTSQSRNLLK
jgi:hypothetical protein